jgi:DNA-binding NarL/FixJ family response regulator
MQVVAEASNGQMAIEVARSCYPNVVVMDVARSARNIRARPDCIAFAQAEGSQGHWHYRMTESMAEIPKIIDQLIFELT